MSQSDRIEYAVYDIATGVVQRVGECSDDDLILQAGEGQHVIAALPDGFDDSAVYWDGTGWAEYPERPYSHLQWDGMQWVDPRDPAQIAAALIAARYATNAPRDTVFYGLYQAGAYPGG